ncbi:MULTISPECIES: DUF1294 domain-containing protein [Anaerococcus]|uniref:DUF1294 domain-containing protein n=1 Tax=Anaerococcus TaxID=165779 RepID=UPI00242A3561|nr:MULTISPECIES: DUF1294 domain-containing protein [Anaerococcus]MDD7767151.1 DUF1294 domain-containing protein [Anaerococcus vaginalis]MDU5560527.1 DUF1294 domain-containing protein [Anaerococcus vaginalis]MDY6127552.1 DUF1294 domain-containing protein [Anaerococcus sp.]
MKIKYLILYFIFVSLISIFLVIYDKIASKKFKRNRIRENILLLFAFMGGAFFMYITMKLIHHKTRHKKFMIGIPIFIGLHIFLGFYLFNRI